MRRVVVTGLGLVTPLGATTDSTWNNLIEGKSGIRQIPSEMFDASDLATKIAGIVPEFDLEQHIPSKDQRKMDKFIHFAVVAADQAIADAKWTPTDSEELLRAGVMVGSGIGGLSAIEENTII